jgi:UPF0176 protein
VIDTRNAFEVAMGTFEGAVDPNRQRFGEFPDYVAARARPRHGTRRIAMFCTGGIRCEKASAPICSIAGLQGGLPPQGRHPEISGRGAGGDQSLWRGECFVFDERVALGHGGTRRQTARAQSASSRDVIRSKP